MIGAEVLGAKCRRPTFGSEIKAATVTTHFVCA
jgi:hypothetical protein